MADCDGKSRIHGVDGILPVTALRRVARGFSDGEFDGVDRECEPRPE